MVVSDSALPPHKIKAHSAWGGLVTMRRNTFKYFKKETKTKMRSTIFGSNPYSPDYIPRVDLFDTVFEDIEQGALAYFTDPPQAWAIIKDCGEWPCSGPLNVLYNFKNSVWQGTVKPQLTFSDF